MLAILAVFIASYVPARRAAEPATGRHNSRLERMNSEICLSCEAIERYLGEEEERVHALRGVSLDVEPGTVHAVVGPSGCGKSSLLYILGLLDLPDAGRVSIESEPVSQLSDDELAQKAEQASSASFFNSIS